MKFTDLFIKRPVLAIVVNLVILIAGLQAIRSLSVRQYPRSDIAVVQVSTTYTGANADLVRGFITTPLERVIASADGIDYMESSSAQGLSTITVHLKLNYDTNAALTQIQAKVAQVRNDLPPDSQAPVIDLETADNQFASMYLGFSSKDLDQNQITDYLTRVVQPKLSAISGVQRADILGDRTFAMRIWLKPDKMAALGISPAAVHDALAKNNYLSALGNTKGTMVSVNLVANTNLTTADEFRQLVVKQEGGVVVRLGEIADVVLGEICQGHFMEGALNDHFMSPDAVHLVVNAFAALVEASFHLQSRELVRHDSHAPAALVGPGVPFAIGNDLVRRLLLVAFAEGAEAASDFDCLAGEVGRTLGAVRRNNNPAADDRIFSKLRQLLKSLSVARSVTTRTKLFYPRSL